MIDWERDHSWYHGSPYRLTTLRAGSTITQRCELARVFSHKPSLVCIADDGMLQHNGATPGWLYRIAEELQPEDIYPHPRTTMPEGWEWLTRRELRLELIGPTAVRETEWLNADAVAALRQKASARKVQG